MSYLLSTNVVPGARPGDLVESDTNESTRAVITMARYNAEELTINQKPSIASVTEPDALDAAEISEWLDVAGTLATADIKALSEHYGWHKLAAADAVNIGQRPKLEVYGEQLFVVAVLPDVLRSDSGDWRVDYKQLVFFVSKGQLVSVHDGATQGFAAIYERIADAGGLLRKSGSDYLLYCLLDIIVDSGFRAAETLAAELVRIEDEVFTNAHANPIQTLHQLKRAASELLRICQLQADMLWQLERSRHRIVDEQTRPYLRDCLDHAVRVQESVATEKEEAASLLDTYLSMSSHRLNDVMKLLTLVSTIFIPLGFFVGLYGMNFDTASPFNMPELRWRYGYIAFWVVIAIVVTGQLWYFRRKRWL